MTRELSRTRSTDSARASRNSVLSIWSLGKYKTARLLDALPESTVRVLGKSHVIFLSFTSKNALFFYYFSNVTIRHCTKPFYCAMASVFLIKKCVSTTNKHHAVT